MGLLQFWGGGQCKGFVVIREGGGGWHCKRFLVSCGCKLFVDFGGGAQ